MLSARSAVLIAAACAGLAGCFGGTSGGDAVPTSAVSSPAPAATAGFTEHQVAGVRIGLPANWTETETSDGLGLQLADSGGNGTVMVIVNEVVRNSPGEIHYTASSYLEKALPWVLHFKDSRDIEITADLTGQARSLTVPGAENAAWLEVTGKRGNRPVACSVVAAQVGPNMAVIVGLQLPAQLWQQVMDTLRVDPNALEPT